MSFLTLLSLALAPGCAIMVYIYLKDKHEREPLSLLVTSFIYGCISTLITLAISYPVDLLILTKEDDVIEQFFNAFFKVALIEEFSEARGCWHLRSARNPHKVEQLNMSKHSRAEGAERHSAAPLTLVLGPLLEGSVDQDNCDQ